MCATELRGVLTNGIWLTRLVLYLAYNAIFIHSVSLLFYQNPFFTSLQPARLNRRGTQIHDEPSCAVRHISA